MTPLHQHMMAALPLSGKGERTPQASVREVRLLAEPRARLRPSWQTHRHKTWLFPATGRHHPHSPLAASPMSRSSVQGAFRIAIHRAGMTKTGVAIHPLRHAYAPHLLAAGVNPRLIQRSLGHPHRDTTMVSLHLTHTGHAEAYERINALLQGLRP